MKKLIVFEWVTLDGIFDATTMNQWFIPYDSKERQACIAENIHGSDAILFGRETYEMLAPYWSSLKNNEMGVADKLNNVQKYVASTTMKKADWNNTTIISKNLAEEVAKLKKQPGKQILVEGSAVLVQSLAEAGLVDEYRLLVHPFIMGSGKRFFKEGATPAGLTLISSQPLPSGVTLLCYEPAKK